MTRYVIQEHHTEPLHWDLMVERDGALATWSLAGEPLDGVAEVGAKRIADHRRAWLDQEGEVSGGRGWTKIWDRGTCDVDWQDGRVSLRFAGGRITGTYELVAGEDGDIESWIFRRLRAIS